MASVTQRIRAVHQPYGGYLRARDFRKTKQDDQIELFPEENIHTSLVGLAVDYLTRFTMGCPVQEAFIISLAGSAVINDTRRSSRLAKQITGLDDRSITCACKLAGYDVCVRAGTQGYKPVDEINPDANTIFNIRTMVERSVRFWTEYGPIVKSGFTLEGGYTDTIDSGDGDYLTANTLWDFKVSKSGPTSQHTLQLLVYYIMGCHSIHPEFLSITKLGIFNPRLNIVYTYNISDIVYSTILEVSDVVIGYPGIGASTAASDSPEVPASDPFDDPLDSPILEELLSPKDEWTVQDLMDRYGVGRAKITGDLIFLGLPYQKRGRSYYFIPDDVTAWEIRQRSIPYRKNNEIVLPAYTEYGDQLKEELKQAKRNHDKENIAQIKKLLRQNGYTHFDPTLLIYLIGGVAILAYLILAINSF